MMDVACRYCDNEAKTSGLAMCPDHVVPMRPIDYRRKHEDARKKSDEEDNQ